MTHETFGRFGTLAIFDFESKSAQKRSQFLMRGSSDGFKTPYFKNPVF